MLGRKNTKVFKRVGEMKQYPKMFLQGCIFRVNSPRGLSNLLTLACWANEQERGKTLKAAPTTGALSLLHINHLYLLDSHKTSILIPRAPLVLVVGCILLSLSGNMNLSLFRQLHSPQFSLILNGILPVGRNSVAELAKAQVPGKNHDLWQAWLKF